MSAKDYAEGKMSGLDKIRYVLVNELGMERDDIRKAVKEIFQAEAKQAMRDTIRNCIKPAEVISVMQSIMQEEAEKLLGDDGSGKYNFIQKYIEVVTKRLVDDWAEKHLRVAISNSRLFESGGK